MLPIRKASRIRVSFIGLRLWILDRRPYAIAPPIRHTRNKQHPI